MRWPSPVLTYGLWLYQSLLLPASPPSASSTRLLQLIADNAKTAVVSAGNHRVLSMTGAVRRMEGGVHVLALHGKTLHQWEVVSVS